MAGLFNPSNAELRDLYNNAPCGFHSLNKDGIFIAINDTELRWLGYTRDQVLGKMSFPDILTPKGKDRFEKSFPIFKEKGEIRELEHELVRRDGSTFPVLLSATAVFDGNGQYWASRSTVFDISERKQAERALRRAYDELEMHVEDRTRELKKANLTLKHLDEMKSGFILAASHELKTPLTSIKGYISLILSGRAGPITAPQHEFLTHVKRATDRLSRLLGELLSISKIESGQISMNLRGTHIEHILKEEVMIFKAEADQKQIDLDFTLKSRLHAIRCDSDKIREVLDNLINNALKFTPKHGRVEVSARRADDVIEIQVSDTGIGIRPEDQLKIFDPFHHVHQKGLEGEESTGLGLALAKRIVEAHRGKIWVESEEGKGSVFTVTLPGRADVREPETSLR